MPQITLTAEIQPEQMGQRLDQTLAELFPEYSRSRLKTWIEAKQVKMNGETADIPRAKVYGGEQIEISVEVEDENRFEPQNIPLNIVYEDDDIIVINKPKDLVVHPGAGNPNGTVLNALLYHYPPIAEVPLLFIAMGVFVSAFIALSFIAIPEPHLRKAGCSAPVYKPAL